MSDSTSISTKIIRSYRVRMVLVGALSVALAYATFLLFIQLGFHYQIASVANFMTYWVINFFLNKNWAFKSTGNIRKEALSHITLHLGNQILIMIGLYFLIEHMGIHAAWSQIIMQILATIAVFLITPIIFKSK